MCSKYGACRPHVRGVSMMLAGGDKGRDTLDLLLSTTYCHSQMYLSRQLAQLHPELTMPMFSALDIEVMRANEGEARRVWSSTVMNRRKRDNPEKTRETAASSGMIPICRNPRAAPPGIEPSIERRLAGVDVRWLVVSAEVTYRFQTARPELRQLLLHYLLPWLHNMELVDPNVPPTNPLFYFQVSLQSTLRLLLLESRRRQSTANSATVKIF
ncbi:hypothetical protein PR048_021958 [Dryococelus australis]|uniref:Uncharacterized protein n=1 Tax=Dryococelus australis TaxID=614101 RepID=A0ABQ9GZN2_9NEOP|nr:hypothetical protein PR048_021958 [Dryococelus australis]